jgi:flagellar protein FlaF
MTMGAGSLVTTAISIVLLVIVAYAVIGGVLVTAEVVATAHKDQVQMQESRLHTSIAIVGHTIGAGTLYLLVENTGSEPVLEFDRMTVFTAVESATPTCYPYDTAGGAGTWSWVSIEPDTIHPHELDPGETINISVMYEGNQPDWAQVTTPNGVSDSAYLR